MQERLVELISQLAPDEVTAELLRINDLLNNLFLRLVPAGIRIRSTYYATRSMYSRFKNTLSSDALPFRMTTGTVDTRKIDLLR